MILLETANRIIADTIMQRFAAEKHEAIDVIAADFDGVKFHISTSKDAKNIMTISIAWAAVADLLKHGAEVLLKHEYGDMLQSSPESGYDVSLQFDLDAVPKTEEFAQKAALFKRHLLAAPFGKIFQLVEGGKAAPPMTSIAYRENESIYIKPEGTDRVTVVFQVAFKDPDDAIFAKVFLQEFRRNVGGAPSVDFTQNEPPGELKGIKGVREGPEYGYVSFVFFQKHIAAAARQKTINSIQLFRNYLHYHIKCSKAYMHSRMRTRVSELLKVLNRARPDPLVAKEKKTIAGRTFKRA